MYSGSASLENFVSLPVITWRTPDAFNSSYLLKNVTIRHETGRGTYNQTSHDVCKCEPFLLFRWDTLYQEEEDVQQTKRQTISNRQKRGKDRKDKVLHFLSSSPFFLFLVAVVVVSYLSVFGGGFLEILFILSFSFTFSFILKKGKVHMKEDLTDGLSEHNF